MFRSRVRTCKRKWRNNNTSWRCSYRKEYREYAGLNDVIFELEITPNRPDCLSHIGIAREVAAYYNRKVKYPVIEMAETIESVNTVIKVNIEDKERCKRYLGRVIKNVKIKESPDWLKLESELWD